MQNTSRINKEQKIILAMGTGTLITLVLVVGYASGFFVEHLNFLKPEKPDVIPVNPRVQAEFDMFYQKYPNISQEDVNQLHSNVLAIMTESEDTDTAMGHMIYTGMMKVFTNGMIENYLDGLDIRYYSADKGAIPELI